LGRWGIMGPYDSAQVDRKPLSLGMWLARREKIMKLNQRFPYLIDLGYFI
jgi:hypothetical protein